jgi:hypothetical protein
MKGLDAKLKASSKALEEAQTCLGAAEARHKEELATAKQATAQAVKEAEARAATVEDALAKVGQKQSKHEEAVVKRLDVLSTSFGSKCFLLWKFLYLLLCEFWTDHCILCCIRIDWGNFQTACRKS